MKKALVKAGEAVLGFFFTLAAVVGVLVGGILLLVNITKRKVGKRGHVSVENPERDGDREKADRINNSIDNLLD
jgi:hypothetical protein